MHIDFLEAVKVIPRCLGATIFLFFITKIMGRKQVSEFSLFDYVIGISIGNFTAEMTLNTDVQYINGMVAVATFGLFSISLTKLINKNIRLRRFVVGTPTVLIDNGKIIQSGLKRVNIGVNDLLEEARMSGYFDISEVDYAIMEGSGTISFLPKREFKNVTVNDLNIKTDKSYLSANIIINGEYMEEAIKKSNITKEELIKRLKKMNLDSPDSILLCTITNNKLNFYFKDQDPINDLLLE